MRLICFLPRTQRLTHAINSLYPIDTLLRAKSFTLDGEAVVCGPDGVAIFDALHRRGTVTEAMLYAFDRQECDGEDLAPYRWATARSGWRGCWAGAGSASC
jgi:ATP-dependent DNA ligase